MSIKSRQQLPDLAKPVADLIEKLGFTGWDFDFEYPTPNARDHIQIREESHYVPTREVNIYAAAMQRGDKFPPVIVTRDGKIVDGASRAQAAYKNGFPYVQAFILNESSDTTTAATRRRLRLLGAGANARHGKGIDRREIQQAIEYVGEDTGYTATRIAALMGVTEETVRSFLYEKRARDRFERLGVVTNGSLNVSQLRALGKASERLNDEPFKAITSLAQDAGLSVGELGEVIREVRDGKSDNAALAAVEDRRQAEQKRIAEHRATGKSRPAPAGQVRRGLGYIFAHEDNVQAMVEYSRPLAARHLDEVERAIVLLTSLAEEQRKFIASTE